MHTEPKLSEILKRTANKLLLESDEDASDEASSIALLIAQLAWNHARNQECADIKTMIASFEASNPNLWSELITPDLNQLVDIAERFVRHNYSHDKRIITLCGITPEGNLRVEWVNE